MAGSEPLFKLIRDGQLELDGELAQSALQTIRVGTEVQVQVAGMADSVAGTVRLLAPKVDAGTRLGRVRISLAATADVRAGSFASSRIETGTTAAAVVIPLRAVTFADDGGATVMVLDVKGQASVRSVVLGQRNSLRVQVSSGLAAGERVVASASAFVRNGDVVSLAQELEQ
ncbi:efflux transporter, RND family, MFP subunit [compost metagenome]